MAHGEVVWVLGAGFSKPLGGPLLGELFGPNAIADLESQVPGLMYRGPPDQRRLHLEAALWLYNYGIRFRNGALPGDVRNPPPAGEQLWDDPEEFLDVLGTAVSRDHGVQDAAEVEYSRLTRIISTFPHGKFAAARYDLGFRQNVAQDIRALTRGIERQARRLMAVQCSVFQARHGVHEKWAAHSKWGKNLKANETVITFNYDCAVELVARNKIVVVTGEENAKQGNKARLFKLHGSTDWTRNGLKVCRHYKDDEHHEKLYTSLLPDTYEDDICLGTPGPGKRELVTSLEPIWNEALKAIREAEVIIFVGYRFPPTDYDAREKVLDAIGGNTTPRIFLHTVLGSDVNDKDTRRLRGLLLSRMGRRRRLPFTEDTDPAEHDRMHGNDGKTWYAMKSHPLFSQDFVGDPVDLYRLHYRHDYDER